MKSQRYGRSHPRSGFTPEEDCLLIDLVAQFGNDSWTTISSYMEKRNARQCKDRYTSYLSPTINNGPYSEEEDDLLRKKYNEIGPKWVKISKFFPNRTDISVKCRWAVLNRRDMKLKEKKLCNIHSNNSKQKSQKKTNYDDDFYDGSDSASSSSPIDPDFSDNSNDDGIFMQKRNGSTKKRNSSDSKSFGSTMTIRKRTKKNVDYDENKKYDEIDEITQSKETNSSDVSESNSLISAPSSLTPTDNDSSANSPGTNLNGSTFTNKEVNKSVASGVSPAFSIENSSGQNQTQFIPLNNAMFFDSFPSFSFGKLNDESSSIENHALFYPMQSTFNGHQMINAGMMKNEIFNNFYNPNKNFLDGLNRFNSYGYQGSYFNNFQTNKKNNLFNGSSSIFVPTSASVPLNNMNTLFTDKNKNNKLEEEVFADDLNWDISWDISLNDVKENPTSVNLFCNSHQAFE